jgi:hypothetical protein
MNDSSFTAPDSVNTLELVQTVKETQAPINYYTRRLFHDYSDFLLTVENFI